MLSRIEEISLIARCVAADDRRAFGRLVEEHQPALRRFLFNLTGGDAAMADDLAQEAFIKAYTGLRQFKGVARFRTWLYTIAVREFANAMRAAHEAECGPDTMERVADSYTSRAAERSEASHDVAVAMRALNPSERTLVMLYYFDDRPIREIVKMTGMPEGTVKVYLQRAKAKMARVLQNDKQ